MSHAQTLFRNARAAILVLLLSCSPAAEDSKMKRE